MTQKNPTSGSPKESDMANEKKDLDEQLRTIPGYSQGVRDNAAVRMIKLAVPICPRSRVEMEQDKLGNWRPKKAGPDTESCQKAGPGWWDICEKKGHDPYFTTHKWEVEEPILTEDEQGRLVQTGKQVFYHEERVPNVSQVAVSIRINQGRGAANAIERKGFKRLPDIGYYEVCQFRNCQKPVSSKYKSKKFGDYCSLQHLQLIAADAESVMLHYPDSFLNGAEHQRILREREKQLREASVGAIE